ncbi:hypothetical protein [Haliscomenobacter sp.]|uniref:hypothetical protein n=1 Tax=Haliscomenobacter sp. TaxID=2717303 RepID=UPI003593F9D9
MKKYLRLLVIAFVFAVPHLHAQQIAQGFQYQAVARDPFNLPMASMPVALKISLVGDNQGQKILYTEQHQVTTNEQGLFSIVVGEGAQKSAALADVDWGKEEVWLKVELSGENKQPFVALSNNRLMSAPYAMHAGSATKLVPKNEDEPIEKNQSIYWTTSGNSKTVPTTHFVGTRDNQNLVFKTNNVPRATITKEGQMQYQSGVDGEDTEMSSYPMVVQGSNQGIYIKVNGSRSYDNDFLRFADDFGTWGAVEGQTVAELEDYWEYKLTVAVYALQGVSLAAQLVTTIAEAIGFMVSVFGAGAGAADFISAAVLVVNIAGLIANATTWSTEIHNQIGVSYSSGAADYAEWLERKEGERDLRFAEIVGVRAGKISLNTSEADHYRVISKNPAVLGNAPDPTQAAKFEKVAFMGQVLVKIAGAAAVGDYIVPSGNNDGFGIAVHPKEMKIGDYARIIGVAWEAAPEAPINYINVAVGINSNDLSGQVELLEQKVQNIKGYLKGQNPLLAGNADFASATLPKQKTTLEKQFSNDEFDKMIDDNRALYNDIYAKVKTQLQERGYDINANPLLVEFFENPTEAIKMIRRDPQFASQWALVDKKLKSGK